MHDCTKKGHRYVTGRTGLIERTTVLGLKGLRTRVIPQGECHVCGHQKPKTKELV